MLEAMGASITSHGLLCNWTCLLLQIPTLRGVVSALTDTEPTYSCSSLVVTKNNPYIFNAWIRSPFWKANLCREITKTVHSLTHTPGAPVHHTPEGYGGFSTKVPGSPCLLWAVWAYWSLQMNVSFWCGWFHLSWVFIRWRLSGCFCLEDKQMHGSKW